MSLPRLTPENVMMDVRERLARIEVKIDNTNEKLRGHDNRLSNHETRLDAIEDDVKAFKTRVATVAKIGSLATAAIAALAWLVDHGLLLAIPAS